MGGGVLHPSLHPLQFGTAQDVLNWQSDIPLTIQDCWLPTAHLPASLIIPLPLPCQPYQWLTAPLLAQLPPTALPCCPGYPQLPFPASLVTSNCPPLQAWLFSTTLPARHLVMAIFDHIGKAIFHYLGVAILYRVWGLICILPLYYVGFLHTHVKYVF